MRKLSFLLFIIFVALFATGADCFAKSRTTPERVIVVPNNGHDKDTATVTITTSRGDEYTGTFYIS